MPPTILLMQIIMFTLATIHLVNWLLSGRDDEFAFLLANMWLMGAILV